MPRPSALSPVDIFRRVFRFICPINLANRPHFCHTAWSTTQPDMKHITKHLLISLLLIIAVFTALSTYNLQQTKPETIPLSEVTAKIQADEITKIEVKDDTLALFTQENGDSPAFTTTKQAGQTVDDFLINNGISAEQLANLTIEVRTASTGATILRYAIQPLLYLVVVGLVFWFLMRQMTGANNKAMSFGQSRAKEADPEKKLVSFSDVAGSKEAKEELQEVVDFLKFPKKYAEVGAKIPKGVLLMGSPGTGKTLLARAVAGEAKVPFFHISGSEFVEMFVGVGASRVRDLFAKAQKSAPCIIFIDEIDAVGRKRGTGVGGGHDEREQTLNQILVEMDGFDPNSGVIVMAATNRPDVLDNALLRPGRFDRRIMIDLPSLDDREAILKIHAQKKPLAKDIDLRRVAQRTIGFSGADLMNIMNESAILTARKNLKEITQANILEAIEKVMIGPERSSAVFSEDERKITAYHEAGHAVVGHLLPHADEVHKVSIISRGRAAGYTMSLPFEDKKMNFKQEFIDRMAMMLGGYASEKVIFGDITTGASNDLEKVTSTAKQLVTRWGMSEKMGPRTYGDASHDFLGHQNATVKDYSERTAEDIDAEIQTLVTNALKTAESIVKNHRDKLDKIVAVLLKNEIIEKEEFEAIIGPPVKAPKLTLRTE